MPDNGDYVKNAKFANCTEISNSREHVETGMPPFIQKGNHILRVLSFARSILST